MASATGAPSASRRTAMRPDAVTVTSRSGRRGTAPVTVQEESRSVAS
jgi:hypothetical protein